MVRESVVQCRLCALLEWRELIDRLVRLKNRRRQGSARCNVYNVRPYVLSMV